MTSSKDSWPTTGPAPELTYDADGWPEAVLLDWSYNNKYGVDPVPADLLLPLSINADGTHNLGSGDSAVVGVHRDGGWHTGGLADAFDRLRGDAASRFPVGAVQLLNDWVGPQWPTWRDLVLAANPDRTGDEVDAWLRWGDSSRGAPSPRPHRRRDWLVMPEQWRSMVNPAVISLLDDQRFIVPWWDDVGWSRFGLPRDTDPLERDPALYERAGGHVTVWLCHVVAQPVDSADLVAALLVAWERHLAGTTPAEAAPPSAWDRLQDVAVAASDDARAYDLRPLTADQRDAVLAAAHLLRRRLSELGRATQAATRNLGIPGAAQVSGVRRAFDAASEAHASAALLCRELTAATGAP